MTLSRRSFLKVAGLTAASVAAASMFTACGDNNLLTTRVKYVAATADAADANVKAAVDKANSTDLATFVVGYSDLHNSDMDKEKRDISNMFNSAIKSESYKDAVEVKEVAMDSDDKGYFLKATVGSKKSK